jgi:hypothetical protein
MKVKFLVKDYNDDLDKRQILREIQFIMAEQKAQVMKIQAELNRLPAEN